MFTMNEWNSGQQWCRGDRETERRRRRREKKGEREREREREREGEGEVKRRRGDFIAIGRSTRGQG